MNRGNLRLRALLAALFAVALLATGAIAAKPSAQLRKWNEKIQEAVTLLRRGESRPALDVVHPLLEEMQRDVVPGDGAGKAFGMAVMLQALAEAGLGEERAAAWHWQVAQQLEPSLEGWDLKEFGAAAEVLARHRLGVDAPPDAMEIDSSKPEIVGPKRHERAYDRKRPGAARKTPGPASGTIKGWGEDSLSLVAIIGVDGRASHPRFTQRPYDLALAVSASDWLLDAEFEPATRDGVPTACRFNWRLNYRSELWMR